MGWNDGGEGEGEMREPFGLRSEKTYGEEGANRGFRGRVERSGEGKVSA